MAKKAESVTEIEGYSKDQGGPGRKQCPQCQGYVIGPRKTECPACHYKFPPPSERKVVARPSSSGAVQSSEALIEKKVMLLTIKMGGSGKLLSAVEKVKADPLVDFIISCGGSDNTIRIIKAVEEQAQAFKVG